VIQTVVKQLQSVAIKNNFLSFQAEEVYNFCSCYSSRSRGRS